MTSVVEGSRGIGWEGVDHKFGICIDQFQKQMVVVGVGSRGWRGHLLN